MPATHSERLKSIRHFSKRTQVGMGASALANNVEIQQLAQNEALAADDRISRMSAKLAKFTKTHKKTTKRNTHQTDWRRELANLRESEVKGSKVVSACLEALVNSGGVENKEFKNEVADLAVEHARVSSRAGRSEVIGVYKQKLAELRTILDEFKLGKTNANNNCEEKQTEKMKLCSSLFAELLLRCHQEMGNEQQAIEFDLARCVEEEKAARLIIMKSLREKDKGEETEEDKLPPNLLKEIDDSGFRDNIEMQLLVEELKAKFFEARSKNEETLAAAMSQENDETGGVPPDIDKVEGDEKTEKNDADGDLFTSDDQVAFMKIFKHWESSAKRGGLKKVTERIKLELPNATTKQIKANIAHHVRRKYEAQHRKNAEISLKRVNSQIVDWGLKRITTVKCLITENMQAELMGKINATIRQEQQARLLVLRTAREEATKIENEKMKLLKEQKQKEIDAEAARLKLEHNEKRAMVDSYHQELAAMKAIDDERKVEEDKMEEEERKLRMEENKERITYRFILNQEKMRALEHEANLKSLAERERLERLSALAASVPYFEKILNAKADLSKNTVCREHDIYEEDLRGLHDFQSKQLSCFSNEKVFSDVRFRLGAALHAAGVARSAASRSLVKSIVPRDMNRTTKIMPH